MINDGRTVVLVATQAHEPLSTIDVVGGSVTLLLTAYLFILLLGALGGMWTARGDAAKKEKVARWFTLRVGVAMVLWMADLALHQYLLGRPMLRLFAAWGMWGYALSAVLLLVIWYRWAAVTGWIDHLLDRHLPSRREKTF